jgi:hypothetical protein
MHIMRADIPAHSSTLGSMHARREEGASAPEALPVLRTTLHVAKEVGARLGSREVLLGSLPKIEAIGALKHAASRHQTIDGQRPARPSVE